MNAEICFGLKEDVPLLTLVQREQLRKCLDEQDGQQQVTAVIQSPSSIQTSCGPHCQGTALHRFGQVSGLQRYRCQTCKRTFNALTGTSLARLRMKDKWLDFSETIVQPQTLRQAAATLGVHRNATLRWAGGAAS